MHFYRLALRVTYFCRVQITLFLSQELLCKEGSSF